MMDPLTADDLTRLFQDLTSGDDGLESAARSVLYAESTAQQIRTAGPTLLPTLVNLFRKIEPDKREVVAVLMSHVGEPAVPAMQELLADPDDVIAEAAASELEEFDTFNDDIVDALLDAMWHRSPRIALAAASATLPTTGKVLRGRIEAIGRLPDSGQLDMKHREIIEGMRCDALSLGDECQAIIADAMKSKRERVRAVAIQLRPLALAADALNDESPIVRQRAVESVPHELLRNLDFASRWLRRLRHAVWWTLGRSLAGALAMVLLTMCICLIRFGAPTDWSSFWLVVAFGAFIGPLVFLGEKVQELINQRRDHRAGLTLRERRHLLDRVIKLLSDDDAGVRASAIRTLARIGSQRAIRTIRAMKVDSSPDVRGWVATVLGAEGDIASVLSATHDSHPEARSIAIVALGSLYEGPLFFHPAGSIGRSLAIITNLVRQAFLHRSRPSLPDSVMPILFAALADESPHVRESGLSALSDVQYPNCESAISGCLSDVETTVRVAALTALHNYWHSVRFSQITPFLSDRDSTVKLAASKLICWKALMSGKWNSSTSVSELIKLTAVPDTNVLIHTVQALKQIGDKSCLPAIIQLIRHSGEPVVRENALLAVEAFRDHSAIPLLIEMLDDPNPSFRQSCARVLGVFRASEATPRLIALLQDNTKPCDNVYRIDETAAYALQRIGTPEALAAIEGRS